jgi:hypothetical protein
MEDEVVEEVEAAVDMLHDGNLLLTVQTIIDFLQLRGIL